MVLAAIMTYGIVLPVSAATEIRFEAEDYTSASSALLVSNNGELSNSKYIRIHEYPNPNGYTIAYSFEAGQTGTYEVTAVGSVLDRVYTSDWNIYMNDETNISKEVKLVEELDVASAKDVFKRYSFGLFKEGLEFRTEEEVCTQDMYSILDSVIQTVLTDENADARQLLEEGNQKFQQDFLNNEN